MSRFLESLKIDINLPGFACYNRLVVDMNNRPVEQALATLLPTHANDLPPELLSLAVSLVAQSRSFSSSLKPEEEIARPYACAEIACRRLSRTFKLPPLLGHPPCSPRVYKKLYAFLDRSLAPKPSEAVSRTPRRNASAPSTPKKGLSNGSRTPSKSTTAALPPSVAHTPSKSSPLKRTVNGTPKATPRRKAAKPLPRTTNGVSNSTIIPDAPAWVMTAIRTVCKTLSTPAPRTTAWSRPPISKTLPPHIFAGVSSILYFSSQLSSSGATSDDAELDGETSHFLDSVLSAQQEQNDDSNTNTDQPNEDFKDLIYALIVAIYFIVLARRRNYPSTTSNESADASEAKQLDDKTFSEMRQVALTSLGLSSTERRHRKDVEHWIALIMGIGWSTGREWFENIPQAGDVDGDEGDEGRISDSGVYGEFDDDRPVSGKQKQKLFKWNREGVGAGLARRSSKDGASRGGLLPGLGTMMQDRVDWLSDERREDYLEWKADIMERIDSMRSAMVS